MRYIERITCENCGLMDGVSVLIEDEKAVAVTECYQCDYLTPIEAEEI